MILPKAQRFASSLLATAAVAGFAACSGTNDRGAPQLPPLAAGVHVKTGRLVYVSDFSANQVYVYNYPGGTQSGIIGGLVNPQGMCVDAGDHNLFVSNTGAENVLEYAWGASSPRATYDDAGEFPVACAVDPSTGKLAIADVFSPTTGLGAVTICAKPARCRVYVEPAGLKECFGIAYLPSGDLYVSGTASSGSGIAYLASGSSTWQPVTVRGSLNFTNVQFWDGQYLAVAASDGSGNSEFYRCAANRTTLSCNDRRVVLKASVGQVFLKFGGKGVVGVSNGEKAVFTFAYPAGGSPSKVFHVETYTYSTLVGTAVLRQPRDAFHRTNRRGAGVDRVAE